MSRVLPPGRLTQTFAGTPQYLGSFLVVLPCPISVRRGDLSLPPRPPPAPEVLQAAHGEAEGYHLQVDFWSLGVILYIFLSGTQPFVDTPSKSVMDRIMEGDFSLTGDPWDSISDNAKDLIKRLLTVDPASRITGPEASKHPWLVGTGAGHPSPTAAVMTAVMGGSCAGAGAGAGLPAAEPAVLVPVAAGSALCPTAEGAGGADADADAQRAVAGGPPSFCATDNLRPAFLVASVPPGDDVGCDGDGDGDANAITHDESTRQFPESDGDGDGDGDANAIIHDESTRQFPESDGEGVDESEQPSKRAGASEDDVGAARAGDGAASVKVELKAEVDADADADAGAARRPSQSQSESQSELPRGGSSMSAMLFPSASEQLRPTRTIEATPSSQVSHLGKRHSSDAVPAGVASHSDRRDATDDDDDAANTAAAADTSSPSKPPAATKRQRSA